MFDGIFFINHALKVNQLSVYNDQERFEQTLETIESIDKKCPNNMKVMFDSSPEMPNEEYFSKLSERGVTIIDCGRQENINKFSNAGLRSLSECLSFMICIDWFKQSKIVGKRIYKLSGRYKLNDNFVLNDDSYKDAFVFSESLETWLPKDKANAINATRLFRLRLWHMDFSLLDTFEKSLPLIFKDCMDNDIDVEHSYYKNLRLYNIIELNKIGVCGNIAPSGEYIDE